LCDLLSAINFHSLLPTDAARNNLSPRPRYGTCALNGMIVQSPLLLHLTSSFLISTLRLQIEPESPTDSLVQTPLILISPNRNISLGLHGNAVLADGLPLSGNQQFSTGDGSKLTVMARCEHGFAFRLNVGDMERTIGSPSFCANHRMNRKFAKYFAQFDTSGI
jgi:hypothetical protein